MYLKAINSSFHRWVFLGALVLYLVTAWFSVGYHGEDEHHQVIGFAEYRMGDLPVHVRAWEYEARIRATGLPWVAIGVFSTADAFGVTSPFTKAFLLRMLTALIALLAITGFVRAVLSSVPDTLHKAFILLSYFLWFLPFLMVRFSSETWSGLLFMMGLTTALRTDRSRWWAVQAGVLMALSIWVRVPMVFAVFGVVLWLWRVQNEPRSIFLEFSGAAFAVLLLTTGIDSLFYGTTTVSVWRYFSMAVQGDPGHVFDTLPWYYYAPWIVKYSIPPIGMCILLAFITLLFKHPRHLLVWIIVPFVLVHTFIPHKELRFLYPLAFCVPWTVIVAYREWSSIFENRYMRVFGIAGLGVLVALNLIALVVVGSSPAGNGRVALAKKLHELKPEPGTEITYIIGGIDSWRVRLPHFYLPDGLVQTSFDRSRIDPTFHVTKYIVAHEEDAAMINEKTRQNLELIMTTETALNEQLLQWYSWGERPERWGLFRVVARNDMVNSDR